MHGRVTERKAEFKAACALAGTTMLRWCKERGITYTHLYHVLDGRRESASLVRDVDAFIAEHRGKPAESAA